MFVWFNAGAPTRNSIPPPVNASRASGTPIAAGGEEEIELRACAGHAVELIVAFKNKAGAPLRAVDIDHILWHRSVEEPRYRNSEPHRTRTIFY